MKSPTLSDNASGNRRKTNGHKPVYRGGIPALAGLSMAGPIAWLTLPSAQVKTGYTFTTGPDPRR